MMNKKTKAGLWYQEDLTV